MTYSREREWLERHEQWRVGEELGRGGQGVVFRAHDRVRSLPVALKVAPREPVEGHHVMRSEFRVRSGVTHPHLVQLFDLVVEADHAVLSMELMDGAVDVVTRLQGAPPNAFARLLCPLISALHRLHTSGLVHRDVKPSNVLVDKHDRCVLVDFGLMEPVPDSAAIQGFVSGTPAYLAPERLRGQPASPASDLYALGLVLQEAVTGEEPRVARIPMPPEGPWKNLLGGLLEPDPLRRWTARQAFMELERMADGVTPSLPAPLPGRHVPWVGRTRELAQIHECLDEPGVLWVSGGAGMGKSSLIWRALAERPDRLVLTGRLHPREHGDHSGWAEIVEDVVRKAALGLCVVERPARDVGPLLQRFPMLGQLFEGPFSTPSGSPADLRHDAINALAEVLRDASSDGMVIWLDDIHWAGDDTLDILIAMCAAQTGIRFVLTSRGAPPAAIEEVEIIELGPLSVRDAHALAGADAGDALVELVRRQPMLASDLDSGGVGGVAQLLTRRKTAVRSSAAGLLRFVALSEGPLPWSVLRDAAESDETLYADVLSLQQARLVQRASGRRSWSIEVSHALLRDAERDGLTPDDQVHLHATLARAYARVRPEDHLPCAHHLFGSGDSAGAAVSLRRGAVAARSQLRLADAASMYERAESYVAELAIDGAFQAERATCDAERGHHQEAGARFLAASELEVAGDQRADLHRAAAEAFVRSGDLHRGIGPLRRVMRAMGAPVPGNALSTAIASMVLRGWFLSVERLGSVAAREPNAAERSKLRALWTGCTSLSHVNPMLGDVFLLRHLLLARKVGTPGDRAKSLAYESTILAAMGPDVLTGWRQRLMKRADALAEEPYDRAWVAVSRCSTAVFEGRWSLAITQAQRAETLLTDTARPVVWEHSVVRTYQAIALSMAGRFAELRRLVEEGVTDAQHRRDPVAANGLLCGHPSILGRTGEPVAATPILHRGGRGWPEASYTAPDYYALVAEVERALYEGRPRDGLDALRRDWSGLRRNMLLSMRFVGVDLRYLRARCRRALGLSVRVDLRVLRQSREPVARAYALAVQASDRESFDAAERAFVELDMCAYAGACALRAGHERGYAELEALGVCDPERLARMLVGGSEDALAHDGV